MRRFRLVHEVPHLGFEPDVAGDGERAPAFLLDRRSGRACRVAIHVGHDHGGSLATEPPAQRPTDPDPPPVTTTDVPASCISRLPFGHGAGLPFGHGAGNSIRRVEALLELGGELVGELRGRAPASTPLVRGRHDRLPDHHGNLVDPRQPLALRQDVLGSADAHRHDGHPHLHREVGRAVEQRRELRALAARPLGEQRDGRTLAECLLQRPERAAIRSSPLHRDRVQAPEEPLADRVREQLLLGEEPDRA